MASLAHLRAERTPTPIVWSRWVAVLPAAIFVSNFVAGIVGSLVSLIAGQVIAGILTSFVGMAVYVMAGSIVAPSRKTGTALALIALAAVIGLIAVLLRWSGVETPWIKWRDPGSPLSTVFATAAAIGGCLTGFYWIRDDEARRRARTTT